MAKTDLGKLMYFGFFLNLLAVIMVQGWAISQQDAQNLGNIQASTDTTTIMAIFSNSAYTQAVSQANDNGILTCNGNYNCTQTWKATNQNINTGYDPIQTQVNWWGVTKFIGTIIVGMLAGPLMWMSALIFLHVNPLFITIAGIVMIIVQLTIVMSIVRFFTKST